MTQLSLNLEPPQRVKNARVWLWCAHLMRAELDAIAYSDAFAMNLDGERERRAPEMAMLAAAADRFVEKADEVGGPDFSRTEWRAAIVAFSGE